MSLVPHIENSEKKDHEVPAVTENGMVWKSPSMAIFCGGTGSGKTNCLLAAVGHQSKWRPYKHIFLLSPNVEAAVKGEYGILGWLTMRFRCSYAAAYDTSRMVLRRGVS